MNYSDFINKLKEIKEMRYVESHRIGDTGIGKTLEDLLGISENNIAGPDFEMYELKSARKNSSSMLTLFTKAPLPNGANRNLLDALGYRQRKVPCDYKQMSLEGEEIEQANVPINEKELHVTVDSLKPNCVGLVLEIKGDCLYISNDKGVEAYYDNDILRASFEKKYHKLVYVLADNKKEQRKEQFWFNEAYRLHGFGFERFSKLVKDGLLKVDIRIGHYPNGRLHDHGTGFRIMPKFLPECFEKIEKIL